MVLSEQEITLSEHHIYGSSRLGYKKYMPKQVYAYWNKEDSLSNYDTLSLISRRPWYSTEYQDVINGTGLLPYGQTDRTTYAVQNIIGQKQYEFTNHLGNVLATTSDLPYRTGDHVSTGSYSAALKSAYDYYPFGSLKPGRFLSDTTSRCVTYTQSKWVVKTRDSSYWIPGRILNATLQPVPLTSTPRQIVNVVNQGAAGYLIAVTDTALVGANVEVHQELAVRPNETQTIMYSAEVLKGAFVLQAVEVGNGNERLLASTNLLPGGTGDDGSSVAQNFTLTITPQTSTVSLRLSAPQNLGSVGTAVTPLGSPSLVTTKEHALYLQKVTVKVNYLEQEQFTVTLCDSIDDKYRFGFNGQEKVNEIAGIGNSLDFGARMYDSRLGRFLSLDPLSKKFSSESNYIFAGNNPIAFIDKDGEYKISANDLLEYRDRYPLIVKYIESQIQKDILKSQKMIDAYNKLRPNHSKEGIVRYIKFVTTWGSGPYIKFETTPCFQPGVAACYDPEMDEIKLNATLADNLEWLLKTNASYRVKQVAFMRFFMDLTHETAHKFNYPDKLIDKTSNPEGLELPITTRQRRNDTDEVGFQFEDDVWGYEKYKSNVPVGKGSDKAEPVVIEGVIDNAEKTPEGRETLPTIPVK